jgi:non-homologous end joining protein Ku
MAYRPTWQGHLRLSLVTCPVALYTATNSGGDVHFNLINPKTNNRIKMITTDPDTGPIERSELVKGYEVSKGEYILLTDEEIKASSWRAPRPSTSSGSCPPRTSTASTGTAPTTWRPTASWPRRPSR